MDIKNIKKLIETLELNTGYGKLLKQLYDIFYEAETKIAMYEYVINNCKDYALVGCAIKSIETVNIKAWEDTVNVLYSNNLMYDAEGYLIKMIDTTDVPF